MKKKTNEEETENIDKIKEEETKNNKNSKKTIKRAKKSLKIDSGDEIKKNADFNLLEVVIIIVITGIVVSIASGLIVYNNYDKLNNIGETNNLTSSDLKEFEDNYNKIVNNYVEEVNKEELLDAAISGMYNYLGDEYSTYINKDSTDTLEDTLTGEYEGIGVEITTRINEDETLQTYITRVFKNTPAEEAGLKVNDILLELNGESLKDKDSSYVANTIKNGAQTENTIKVLRDNKEIELKLTRKHIYIDSVTSEVKGNVGYIKIETFSLTTVDQVKKCLDSFDEKVRSLVIDVRDNTGGYLNVAYDLSELFVEKGKNIYQIKYRDGKAIEYKAVDDIYRKYNKIAVLINESSASASEIFALAIKESADGILVGVKSYGKGTVQETVSLESGAMAKYTSAYWLSPNGNSINKLGIDPDIIEKDANKQLDKAIEAVK